MPKRGLCVCVLQKTAELIEVGYRLGRRTRVRGTQVTLYRTAVAVVPFERSVLGLSLP